MGRLAMSSSCPGRSRFPGGTTVNRKQQIIKDALSAARSNEVHQRELELLWARKKRREEMQRRLIEAGRQNGIPVRGVGRDEYREERDDSSRDVWSARSNQGSDDDSAYSEEELSLIEEIFEEICDAFDAVFGDIASVFEQPEPKKKKKNKKKGEQKRYASSGSSVSSQSTRSAVSSSGRSSVSSYSARSTGTSSGMSMRGGVQSAKSKSVAQPKKQSSLQLQSASQHIRSASHAKSVNAPYGFVKSPSTSSVRSAASSGSRTSGRSAKSRSRSPARHRSKSPARHRSKSPARRRSRSRSTTRSNRSSSSRKSDGSIRAKLDISSNSKLVAQRRERRRMEKERKVKLDTLLVKLAKAEKKMNKNEYEVMETRRRLRAAAAAVNMQNILDEYDTKKEDDFDVIGEKIEHAFGELGSVTSVARDVMNYAVTSAAKGMKPSRRKYYYDDDDDYYDDDEYDDEYYDEEDDDYYDDY